MRVDLIVHFEYITFGGNRVVAGTFEGFFMLKNMTTIEIKNEEATLSISEDRGDVYINVSYDDGEHQSSTTIFVDMEDCKVLSFLFDQIYKNVKSRK